MEAGTGTSHIDGIAEEQGRGPEAINSFRNKEDIEACHTPRGSRSEPYRGLLRSRAAGAG